ncbi:hypothetical protein JL09_g5561 [Pichia kudriavzevii]|uniref:Uncharacterized protein n=1 Tax=Pichia kudriavzevii TaxID=4909 RepID=A0A099NTF4_PICKU|nr:hypothetical protein JL09_g5561 [Pichia kudriavzevii]
MYVEAVFLLVIVEDPKHFGQKLDTCQLL